MHTILSFFVGQGKKHFEVIPTFYNCWQTSAAFPTFTESPAEFTFTLLHFSNLIEMFAHVQPPFLGMKQKQ